jgi:uncharacterized protein (DUF885 family)
MRNAFTPTWLVVLSLILPACTASTSQGTDPAESSVASTQQITTSTPAIAPEATTPTSQSAELAALADLTFEPFLEAAYEALLLRTPQFLTSLGVSAEYGLRDDQLDNLSPAYLAETQSLEIRILEQLRSFDRTELLDRDQISYDVFEWYLDQKVRGHRFAYHDYPVHYFVNSYNFNLVLFLTEEHPLETLEDAEDYITRLSLIDDQVAQVLERLRMSEEMGVLPPSIIVTWTSGSLQENLGGTRDSEAVRVTRLPLYTAFEERIAGISDLDEATREELLEGVAIELETSFVPAWVALIDHMEQIRASAPTEAGVWRLPDGDAYYEWLLRDHTSTDLTAAEIHQLGLEGVERVEAELRAAFDRLGYPEDGSLGDLRRRAADEAGYMNGSTAGGAEEILDEYNRLIAGAEEVAGEFFGRRPVASVGIVPEAAGRGGYYVAASVDGSRPGAFHAGVGGQVAAYTMPTITYHEAVPGHHTQIAIAQELDLPTFRRYIQYNAFAEGWALYAERLAWEMGLYEDDPYGNIGRLELELLRAVRLVVDTGLHSLRWTRQEAHDYMNATIARWSPEVERYMVLPGQATGYMIGMQTILELREFLAADGMLDIAAFHDLVLGGGSLPLGVLESVVAARAAG